MFHKIIVKQTTLSLKSILYDFKNWTQNPKFPGNIIAGIGLIVLLSWIKILWKIIWKIGLMCEREESPYSVKTRPLEPGVELASWPLVYHALQQFWIPSTKPNAPDQCQLQWERGDFKLFSLAEPAVVFPSNPFSPESPYFLSLSDGHTWERKVSH